MRTLARFLPFALAAVLAGMAVSDGHETAGGGPIAGAQVALSAIAAHPTDYLGGELHFTIQVESLPAKWNPYVTRFGTDDYRAVVAWGDEQDLWVQEAYDSPAAMLFARRESALEPMLQQAQRYARFEATGIVRQVLLGRPWIELTDLVPLRQQFTTGSMIHAARGVELMDSEHFDLAAQSFERAMASDLPEHARTELERLKSESLQRASVPIGLPANKRRISTPPAGRSKSH